ncbi:MAG: HAD family hydrolase [Pyrinomonadaceae bacterium]|nr:HAD family hydrolase [Pyrinomonadaceae bacterium]
MEKHSSKKKAVFIDRDGTLIEEVNYLHRVEELRFFDYTDEAVKSLKEQGFLVLVATNQSGIGKKFYTEADMHSVHEAIQNQLTEKIDAFYFCPHLPNAGCSCRKPNLGMIEKAMQEFDIDLENSWMIGDKNLDVELGNNAKIKTALVLTGYGEKHLKKFELKPTIIANTLIEAVNEILKN